jgi:hypothetical protein
MRISKRCWGRMWRMFGLERMSGSLLHSDSACVLFRSAGSKLYPGDI